MPDGSKMQPLFRVNPSGINIEVAQAKDFGLAILGEVTRLCDEQVAKYPEFLNRFDPEHIWNSNALVAIARKKDKLIAAVTGDISAPTTDEVVMTVCNLVSDGSHKGIAPLLMAALHRGAGLLTECAPSIRAYARIMPDGRANIASTKSLMRLGAYAADLITHPVTCRNPQKKSLRDSLASNDDEIQYMLLIGDAKDVVKSVNAILT